MTTRRAKNVCYAIFLYSQFYFQSIQVQSANCIDTYYIYSGT
jgi:hypothetical protein